jgi:hypothetical protein
VREHVSGLDGPFTLLGLMRARGDVPARVVVDAYRRMHARGELERAGGEPGWVWVRAPDEASAPADDARRVREELEGELARLDRARAEYEELFTLANRELESTRGLLEDARAQSERERERCASLEHALSRRLDAHGALGASALAAPTALALRHLRLTADFEYDAPLSLLGALDALEAGFPERVRVLLSARASAAEAHDFEHPLRAYRLMLVLVTVFLDDLDDGGMARAKARFPGTTLATNESRSVRENPRARASRTFEYQAKSHAFWPHLRLGVGEGTRTGWRCHFIHDPEARCIVIGHCGKHLPMR